VTLSRAALRDVACASSREWLLTDGLGGYASSTVIGLNTRRYHGLLIAATGVGRVLLVSKIEDEVWLAGKQCPLSTNQYPGLLHPQGYMFLEEFSTEPVPAWRYVFEDCALEKRVAMVRGEPATMIMYRHVSGDRPLRLVAAPLLNCRDHHADTRRGDLHFEVRKTRGQAHIIVRSSWFDVSLHMRASHGRWVPGECWYENMCYAREAERGLRASEDHFCPGRFEVELLPGEEWTLACSVGKPVRSRFSAVLARERRRKREVERVSGIADAFVRKLSAAADQFIVRPAPGGEASIIAGYPWFGEWGRDAMIGLPGLALVTGRFAEAAEVLLRFASRMRRGLIPNFISESGDGAAYNTVDASLWFIYAAWKYHAYTGDGETIEKLRPRLEEVVRSYSGGTDYGIAADSDGLIRAGEPGLQLTWMDAKVGDWVVTPRHGKAVEVNALWYNGLRSLADLWQRLGWDGSEYGALAAKVSDGFVREFWNEACECLYDVVGERKDGSIRPNQIFAVSLPFPALEGERAGSVVRTVQRMLWTPYGLRTLSPGSPGYRGAYAGDVAQRDGAYHQGTVWPWLMGPFVSAYVRVNGAAEGARTQAREFFSGLEAHLSEAGLGSVSEIFDGDPPHQPRGCIAQAWSVAELLRSCVEDVLGRNPGH